MWRRTNRQSVRDRGGPANAGARYAGLDALRIVAAGGVIFSHSFRLLGFEEPTIVFGSFGMTLGTLCVGLFFTISGFLVAASWIREPRIGAFARKRFARIWPGLVVCLVITAFVLGPAVTSRSSGAYVADPGPWSYVGKGAALDISYELPGLFVDNPFQRTVNGSLWTLPYEVLAYLGLLTIGLLVGLRNKKFIVGITATVLMAFQLIAVSRLAPDLVLRGLNLYAALMFASWFLLGVSMFALDWIPGNRAGIVAMVLAGVAVRVGQPTLFIVSTSILFLWMGSRRTVWTTSIRNAGDPSYGMYIYAFPVQQTFISLGIFTSSPSSMFGAALLISLLLGYLSWHLVEKRALALLGGRNAVRSSTIDLSHTDPSVTERKPAMATL